MVSEISVWGVVTGFFILSIFYSSISIYSIFSKLKKRVWVDVNNCSSPSDDLPRVSVILPLYKENFKDIEVTFKSLASQEYPRDLIDVYVVVEEGDLRTLEYVESLKGLLEGSGFKVSVVVNHGVRRGKASAINSVLGMVRGDVIVIYDAGDLVNDKHHILKVTKLFRSGYVLIGCRVLRVGDDFLGKLSLIDTSLWYDVALPGLTVVTGYPLVSGEGMAISKEFLVRVGGMPNKLTEDSYMTLHLVRCGGRAVLLNTTIFEGAPNSIRGLVKQRLRWYRGYLECLRDSIVSSTELNVKDVLRLVVLYAQPLALTSFPLAIITIVLTPVTYVDQYTLTLAIVTLVALITAPIYILLELGIKDKVIILAPTYWVFQGLIMFLALTPIKIGWLRTERTSIGNIAEDLTYTTLRTLK